MFQALERVLKIKQQLKLENIISAKDNAVNKQMEEVEAISL